MRVAIVFLLIACAYALPVITILVVGNAGVGKSTLINNLMGADVAKTCGDETCTTEVKQYDITKYGFVFSFYDTPGFNDGQGHSDDVIMEKIRQNVDKINIILLCYDLSTSRLMRNTIYADLQRELGTGVKDFTLAVYTKSNLVTSMDPGVKAVGWNDQLHASLPVYLADNRASFGLWMKIKNTGRRATLKVPPIQLVNDAYQYLQTREPSRRGDGCFDANDLVMQQLGDVYLMKPISDVIPGDLILGNDGYTLVCFVYQHQEQMRMIRLVTQDMAISMTSNHIAIYERNKVRTYSPASEVLVGDYLIGDHGNHYLITKIETYQATAKYILTEDDHVMVNGILASAHVDDHELGKTLTKQFKPIARYLPGWSIELMKAIYQAAMCLGE